MGAQGEAEKNAAAAAKPEEQRVWQLELLRIFACLLVLLGHISAQWLTGDRLPGTLGLIFTQGCNILAFSGVSLFVMLSGALSLRREMSVKKALLYRFLHFFILYELWKLLYFVVYVFRSGQAGDAGAWQRYVFRGFWELDAYYHLWYLPMIAMLFLLVPLLQPGAGRLGACLLYLIPTGVLGYLLPTLKQYAIPWQSELDFLTEPFALGYFAGYLGLFLLGHILYHWRERWSGRARAALYLCGAAAYGIACVGTVRRSRMTGELYYGFASPLTLWNVISSSALFLGILSLRRGGKGSGRLRRCLADASFGVYLLHPMVLETLTGALPIRKLPAIAGIPILLAVLYLLTLLFTLLLGRIPLLRRIVH